VGSESVRQFVTLYDRGMQFDKIDT